MNSVIKIINTLLFVLILMILGGCSSQKNKKISPPSWFLNTPKNNTQYFYGSADGYTKEESKNSALIALASRLEISVASKYEQTKELAHSSDAQSQYYSNSIKQNISSQIAKIKFRNVDVEKVEEVNGKIYTLVKVDRVEFLKQKKSEFLEYDKEINSIMSSSNSTLEKIINFKKVAPLIKKSKALLLLISSLSSYNTDSYLNNYQDMKNTNTKLLNTIIVDVKNDNRYFKNEIKSYVSNSGYKLGNTQNGLIVNSSNNISKSVVRGWFISKVSTNIEVSYNNIVINSFTINSVGRSSVSYDLSIISASKNFAKKLSKREIFGN